MKLSRTSMRIVIDRLLPNRPVRRRVRGIEMVLPRRHLLPYMAVDGSPYAQNLVDLAVLLGRRSDDLVIMDVGANVGDSALLILDEISCRIVCVEGDPEWLGFLEQNVGARPEVVIAPVLISGAGEEQLVSIVHADAGTSQVVPAASRGSGVRTVPVGQLINSYPELERVRLVKSDTDGFDVELVRAYARAFAASRPVLFFEYDPRATRIVTPGVVPSELFDDLAELGYSHAVVWTNGGHVIGSSSVRGLTARSRVLEDARTGLGYDFWDVAVAHADDADGIAALTELAARGVQWPADGRF
jgi:FkbM family methyltransferase